MIRDSIRELYAKLSGATVKSYAADLTPLHPMTARGQDPIIEAEQLARTISRHLRMTDVQLIVSFKKIRGDGQLSPAAEIKLGAGPDYFITLSPRYRNDRRDIAAVLAHEVMHIFLHRSGIRFADRIKNEILTDTASVYLGTGWLALNAHRMSTTYSGNTCTTSTQSLGYVSPEELGYILAKRALAGDQHIETHLSPHNTVRHAYRVGYQRALDDYQRAPLVDCNTMAAVQYQKDKMYAEELTAYRGLTSPFDGGYRFQGYDPMKVIFHCPTCHHLMKTPVDRSMTIRCRVCQSALKCET
ncbi:MAG: hypothetical protein M3143_11445 [Actinomycetota bacterium]|nr:hypothetical protein [Actinomycetota bacterium]